MSKVNVKILEEAKPRVVNTKVGQKTVYFQRAQVECEQFRVNIDIDVDGPAAAYAVGAKLEWDVLADLQVGQYSRIELARKMTLKPVALAKAA